MPALFDHAPEPAPARRHHRRTVVVSVALHAAALVAIVVAQLGAAFDGPDVNRRLDLFVMPASPPSPPTVETPPEAPRPAVAVNPDAAPVMANDVVLEAPPPRPAVARGPVPPGALVVSSGRGGAGGPVTASRDAVALQDAPRPAAPIRPGGDVEPPTRTTYVEPTYPEIARASRTEGTVILEATIDETGAVRDVRVLRSIALLDRAALDAVRQWRYTPTRLNGRAVPVLIVVTVTFTLR